MEYELTTVEPTTQNVKPTIMDKSLGTNLHYICGAFSHAQNKFIYTCSSPPPPRPPPTMLDTCTRYFSRLSTLYWGGGGSNEF